MGKKSKQYDRLRFNSGQHRRILLISLLLGILAFVPVFFRLYQLMIEEYDYYAALAQLRKSSQVLQTGHAVFAAQSADVLTVLRYVNDGKDALGLPCENGIYLAVINRGDSAAYCVDCSAAGHEPFNGRIAPCSAELIRIK